MPDNLIVSPVLKYFVAFWTPIAQGKPYSLATTAPIIWKINMYRYLYTMLFYEISTDNDLPWEISPPSSVTTPESMGKYGDQAMSVLWVIRISPVM